MAILDLTVPIRRDTYSPPSVNRPIAITEYHKEPGFWMVTEITMMLHSGSHVDFTKHYSEDGETPEQAPLDRTCGEAVIIDLTPVDSDHDITADDLAAAAPEIRAGDVVLVRTGWSDQAWGDFPRYYVESPACTPDAARWLVDTGAMSIGFDCLPERAAKKQSYLPYEFVVHQIVGDAGVIVMQSLTNPGCPAHRLALPLLRRLPQGGLGAKAPRRATSPSLTELPRPSAPADKGAFGPIPLPERPYLLR
jgi:arylformamidase